MSKNKIDPLSPPNPPFLGFRITTRDQERLELAAKLEQRSYSDIGRNALRDYLRKSLAASLAAEVAAAQAEVAEAENASTASLEPSSEANAQ